MRKAAAFFAFLCAVTLTATLPSAAAGFDMPQVSARLLVAGGLQNGMYLAGLELDLPKGWHTYWQNPGDAGVPPMFDVAKSDNLKDFAVAYPVPTRFSDGGGTSMIYSGRLVLPLRVVPKTAAEPVTLAVRVLYGLCDEICLPAEAVVSVVLEPAAAVDVAVAGDIAAFAARVPVRAAGDRLAIDGLHYDGASGKGSFEVSVADDGELDDLFVIGPPRWYVAPPQPADGTDGHRHYRVAIEGPSGATSAANVELRFVLAEQTHAYEIVRRLDAPTE